MRPLLPLGPTKSKILAFLMFDRRPAGEVAHHLRIQVSAARKHLERLRDLGIVEERFARADRGRPKKLYGLTESGRELLPRRYDVLLNAVLRRLEAERGPADAEAVMNRVASDFADAIGRLSNRSRSEMNRFVAGLRALGFEPSLQERDGSYVIMSGNCPILRVAEAHREVACRGLHGELIRQGVDARDVQRERWILDGAPFCTHVFPKAGTKSARSADLSNVRGVSRRKPSSGPAGI